jgi:hypothetical protein
MRTDLFQAAMLLIIALAGCSGGEGGTNTSGSAPPRSGSPAQTATLTGLYESGEGPRRNQMCVIEREGGRTSFGLVTWGEGDRNCSGSGLARREGNRLRLQMEGDETCVIEASLDGTRVTLPASLPQGCAYYCGPSAQLAGADFDKTGGEEADARRAVDLVGEPLCGG